MVVAATAMSVAAANGVSAESSEVLTASASLLNGGAEEAIAGSSEGLAEPLRSPLQKIPPAVWLLLGGVLAVACLARTDTARRPEPRRRLRWVDGHFPGVKHGTVWGRLFNSHGKPPKSRKVL